jgi:cob(I)alamin adenosyltransferase
VTARRPAIRRSAVATGLGDDGTTGLLFGGSRILKDELQTEASGSIDEAVASLGLARAELRALADHGSLPRPLAGLEELVLRLQRELFVAGAELACSPGEWDRLQDGVTCVSAPMLDALEASLDEYERAVAMPRDFVIPGETRVSAAVEVARTAVRRAERRAVSVRAAGLLPGEWCIAYLNRLADLLWVLARAAEAGEARPATTLRG